MKVIKGINLNKGYNNEKFVDNQKEWASELVNKWNVFDYFDRVLCHTENVEELTENTMYIFCSTASVVTYGTVENIFVEKYIKDISEDKNDGSLDYFNLPTRMRTSSNNKIIAFLFYSRTVGMYCPEKNILWVCDISHRPTFSRYKKFWDFLVKSIIVKKEVNIINTDVKIMLGADPEFEVVNDGNIIMCPTVVTKGRFNDTRLTEKIGTDGARTQIEFRPDPSETPEGLVKNIKNLFEIVNHYYLSAKGQGYPLGGHVHFGIVNGTSIYKKLPFDVTFIRLIDYFIGNKFIKLSGSARGGYAKVGQWRNQPHGFEYRSLPACIFETPELTRIILKICKNIAELYYNEKDIILNSTNYATEKDYQQIGLKNEEIEYLFNFIETYDSDDYSINIVENWVESYNNPIRVEFYDIWAQDIKNKFMTEIKHIKVPKPVTIILYGLSAKKHGIVYAGLNSAYLKDSGYEISHPVGCPHIDNGVAFGIPQAERAYPQRDGRGPIGIDCCIDAIKNVINGIDWDIQPEKITSKTIGVL